MINLISQPETWTSAYDNIFYELTNTQMFYNLEINVSTTMPEYTIVNVFGQFDIFKIGLEIQQSTFFPTPVYKIIGYEGSNIIINREAPSFVDFFDFILFQQEPISCKLLVGYIPTHSLHQSRPIAEYAKIQCIYKDGVYRLNIAGFMQDAFYKLKPENATGVDQNLHLHYELFANEFSNGQLNLNGNPAYNSGLEYKLGDTRYCLNGCVDNLNSSVYVNVYGASLQNPAQQVIKQNQQASIYSYIIDDQVITTTI
jgi:hypothetical protein